MKKKNFIQFLVGTITMAVGLSSCSKCQTCTITYGSTSYSEEVCQSEFFDNKTLWKAYIEYLEAYGYKCK